MATRQCWSKAESISTRTMTHRLMSQTSIVPMEPRFQWRMLADEVLVVRADSVDRVVLAVIVVPADVGAAADVVRVDRRAAAVEIAKLS
jgi:hypothetical protein